MDNVPSRAIYRCPVHGDFVTKVVDNTITATEECTYVQYNANVGGFNVCKKVSPMTTIDQITSDFRPSPYMDPQTRQQVRDTAAKLMHNRDAALAQKKALPPADMKIGMDEDFAKFEEQQRAEMEAALASWTV